MPMHYIARMKTCSHANFRSKTATVIELRFFMKKKKMKKMMYFIPGVTFSTNFFCMQLLFFTLMSLKDRLRLKLKVKTNVWL